MSSIAKLASLAGAVLAVLSVGIGPANADEPLRVAPFQVDVTPPIGAELCYGDVDPAKEIVTPLSARGVVLLGAGEPIVLCALDWVGIESESYDLFRETIATAVGTSADRVAIHTLHQHDAPGSAFDVDRLLANYGLNGFFSNQAYDRDVMQRIAAAVKEAAAKAQPVSHVGFGSAEVDKVASNRRVMGDDGKVAIIRWSAVKDPLAQAAPEGTIDPLVRLVSFWNGDKPVAVLTYYATHPQSYYGKGSVNWDFVGIAREQRQEALAGLPHVHFNGAAGNVTAGKYNDGTPERRPELANRLADGMKRAWETQEKEPIAASGVGWSVVPVLLPPSDNINEEEATARLKDANATPSSRRWAARDLTFLKGVGAGRTTPITCLRLNEGRVLHLPGELFIEYQLAAQQMRPGKFTAMAAYGDRIAGYIGTEISYTQGGYETGKKASIVAPSVEKVLMNAMQTLVEKE